MMRMMPRYMYARRMGQDVMVEPAAWSNMRYHFNEVEKKIEEEGDWQIRAIPYPTCLGDYRSQESGS